MRDELNSRHLHVCMRVCVRWLFSIGGARPTVDSHRRYFIVGASPNRRCHEHDARPRGLDLVPQSGQRSRLGARHLLAGALAAGGEEKQEGMK